MKKDMNKLAKQLRKALQDDILMRYDNPEYWDNQIVEDFYQNNKIKANERFKDFDLLDL